MHRVDSDDNVLNLFSNGDPGIAQPATVLEEAWLNDVQEELCNIIESFGVTLVKGTRTQLRDALKNFTTYALGRAGDQSILKGDSGKLQVGTSVATDLELLRNNLRMLGLTSTGIDCNGYRLQAVANLILQSLTADPTLVDGQIHFRSDLGKLRARIAGATQNLATESYVAAQMAATDGSGALTFGTGWSAPFHRQLIRSADGIVTLSVDFATAGSGATAAIGTLPDGYRPPGDVYLRGVHHAGTTDHGSAALQIIGASGGSPGALNLFGAAPVASRYYGFSGVWKVA